MRFPPGLLLILTACSCLSIGACFNSPTRPSGGEVIAQSGHGRVLCDDISQVEDALAAALAIDGYFVLAGEALGYTRDEPVEIWLVPNWRSQGTTFDDYVVFNPSDTNVPFADLILTHEFVHWHAKGTPLQRNLPHLALEGLCEWIAADLNSQWTADRHKMYSERLSAAREGGYLPHVVSQLSLSLEDWLETSGDERYDTYALGFALVDSIGVDVLREAAERGPLSPEAVLEMAGVSADGTGL